MKTAKKTVFPFAFRKHFVSLQKIYFANNNNAHFNFMNLK